MTPSVRRLSAGVWAGMKRRAPDFSWLLAGKAVQTAANVALMLFLAHQLSVERYGLFVAAIGGQLLLSRLVLLGVDQGMIRLRAIPELRARSLEVALAGQAVVLRMAVVCGILGLAALPVVSWLPQWHWPAWLVLVVLGGGIGTALFDYGCSYFLALRQSRTAGILQGGMPLTRLGVTALAAWLTPGNSPLPFLVYAGAALLFGLALAAALQKHRAAPPDRALIRRVLYYSLWSGGTLIVNSLCQYQGVYLLRLLGREEESGLFGLALSMSFVFVIVRQTVGDYLLPRMVAVESARALPLRLAQAVGAATLLALACLPLLWLVNCLAPFALRPQLWVALPLFTWLSVSVLLQVVQCPLDGVFHYLLRPAAIFGVLVFRTIVTFALGGLLIPRLGAQGAAYAQCGGSAAAVLTSFGLATLLLRRAREEAEKIPHTEDLTGAALVE